MELSWGELRSQRPAALLNLAVSPAYELTVGHAIDFGRLLYGHVESGLQKCRIDSMRIDAFVACLCLHGGCGNGSCCDALVEG